MNVNVVRWLFLRIAHGCPGAGAFAARLSLAFSLLTLPACHTGRAGFDAPIVLPLVSGEIGSPEPGDLLFQDLDGSPFCDAIEAVTRGWRNAALTHVGIVARGADGAPVVLEAVSRGVVETPLPAFLARSRDAEGRPKVLVGRLTPKYRPLIPPAIEAARRRLGRPYDEVFDIANDAYYCSELVHVAFQDANGGAPVFALEPMTFRDPRTGEFFPVWVTYFERLGAPIPEGAPGLNPGGLSRAAAVHIIAAYGRPDGLQVKISAASDAPAPVNTGAPRPTPQTDAF